MVEPAAKVAETVTAAGMNDVYSGAAPAGGSQCGIKSTSRTPGTKEYCGCGRSALISQRTQALGPRIPLSSP
eukprot:199560-Rhodomonas_salina.2